MGLDVVLIRMGAKTTRISRLQEGQLQTLFFGTSQPGHLVVGNPAVTRMTEKTQMTEIKMQAMIAFALSAPDCHLTAVRFQLIQWLVLGGGGEASNSWP